MLRGEGGFPGQKGVSGRMEQVLKKSLSDYTLLSTQNQSLVGAEMSCVDTK